MSERHDAYRTLAAHYDLHRCDWYAETFGPRLIRLLEERGFRESRVLDAGCGTGTLGLALASEGHHVHGLDLSTSMLEVARAKDREERVRWSRGDVVDFRLPEAAPFDVVTCVGDTLNHLPTLEEWERAFSSFAHHLRPGGLLYVDVMTRRGLELMDHYTVTDLPGRTLILGFIFEPDSGRSTMKLTSFTPADGGPLYERVSDTVTEWGQPVSGILERLHGAGFRLPERLWGRAQDPEDDERLTLIATRP